MRGFLFYASMSIVGALAACAGDDSNPPADASSADAAADASLADAGDASTKVPCDGGVATLSCVGASDAGTCRGRDLTKLALPDDIFNATVSVGCTVTSHPSGFHADPPSENDECTGITCTCVRGIKGADGGTSASWLCPN